MTIRLEQFRRFFDDSYDFPVFDHQFSGWIEAGGVWAFLTRIVILITGAFNEDVAINAYNSVLLMFVYESFTKNHNAV